MFSIREKFGTWQISSTSKAGARKNLHRFVRKQQVAEELYLRGSLAFLVPVGEIEEALAEAHEFGEWP